MCGRVALFLVFFHLTSRSIKVQSKVGLQTNPVAIKAIPEVALKHSVGLNDGFQV